MRRIQRTRRGDFRLRLPAEERQVLRALPGQLRELMTTSDASLRRLAPPAYADDPRLEAEYRELVGDDLTAERLRGLEVMEQTVEADRLDEEQLGAWLGAINDLRLVLGTRLDVTEEMDVSAVPDTDPRYAALALYSYLSFLEEQVVEALSSSLS